MFLGSSVAHVPVPNRLELIQKSVEAMILDVRGMIEELEASRASKPELLLALERVTNQFQYSAFTLIYFIRIPCCLVVCSVKWCSTTLAIS
jgi:hypothetical protein